ATRLQPAADGDVIDEQRLAVIGREDHGAGGEVAGIGGALAEAMAMIDLPEEEREVFVLVRDRGEVARDSIAQGGVEGFGRHRHVRGPQLISESSCSKRGRMTSWGGERRTRTKSSSLRAST